MTNNTILDRIKFFSSVDMKFSYGALTSMNEYYYHPQYNWIKRSDWTVSDLLSGRIEGRLICLFRLYFERKNWKLIDLMTEE